MRKGRFELWLGIGCVLLVGLLAFGAAYRQELHARWLFWRFNHSADHAQCVGVIEQMLAGGKPAAAGLRSLLIDDPRKLQVLSDKGSWLTVVNDRPHRVLLRAFDAHRFICLPPGIWQEQHWPEIASSLETGGPLLEYAEAYQEVWIRCDRSRLAPRPGILPSGQQFAVVLEPGEKTRLAEYWSNTTFPRLQSPTPATSRFAPHPSDNPARTPTPVPGPRWR